MKQLLCCVAIAACSTEQVFVEPEGGLQRMQHQPRYDAYERSTFFKDGRTMQTPPDGTIPHEAATESAAYLLGYTEQAYAVRIPVKVSMAMLERGRERYDIFCAPCHGIAGDNNAVVAQNFPLVAPRSLVSEEARAYAPGRIYRAIREGYGLMGSYASQLSEIDRWAVAAYVQALQRAASTPLAALNEAMQREAEEALR